MSEETQQKEKKVFHFLNRDLERKALDRSVARDELGKEEEESEQDDE